MKAEASMFDPAAADVERAKYTWAGEQALRGEDRIWVLPQDQGVAGDTPRMLRAAEGCYVHNVAEQSKLGG